MPVTRNIPSYHQPPPLLKQESLGDDGYPAGNPLSSNHGPSPRLVKNLNSVGGATRVKRRKQSNPPRPSNKFMLFRSDLAKELGGSVNQKELSKLAGAAWKRLSQKERLDYQQRAVERKRQHIEMYPGYVYAPVSKKGKPSVKPTSRRPRAKSSSPSPSCSSGASEYKPTSFVKRAAATRALERIQAVDTAENDEHSGLVYDSDSTLICDSSRSSTLSTEKSKSCAEVATTDVDETEETDGSEAGELAETDDLADISNLEITEYDEETAETRFFAMPGDKGRKSPSPPVYHRVEEQFAFKAGVNPTSLPTLTVLNTSLFSVTVQNDMDNLFIF